LPPRGPLAEATGAYPEALELSEQKEKPVAARRVAGQSKHSTQEPAA